MFGWRVPAPNQAMLISGGHHRGDALPVKIVTGHGAFAMPVRSRVSFLTLAMQESSVVEECVTKQGITLLVKSVIAFKVGDDDESISNAARRFLDDQDQMSTLTGRIFAGHLRSIIGSMTVEDLIRERQKLAEEVLDASKTEMARIGLTVDSLQIQSIDDKGSGYIAALAAPHQAAVNQIAQIAQAQAQQAAAEAQQASARAQAEYERQTAVARASYQSEIEAAQARAAQSGPLASAQTQQEVLVQQAKVAERNAELRQAQLVAEIVKPALAEAERIRTLARAQADQTLMSAEAASAEGRIALDQAIIAQLPQMISAAAAGLASANVTVLNGAEGLNGTVASLASQGLAILRTVTEGLAESHTPGTAVVPTGPVNRVRAQSGSAEVPAGTGGARGSSGTDGAGRVAQDRDPGGERAAPELVDPPLVDPGPIDPELVDPEPADPQRIEVQLVSSPPASEPAAGRGVARRPR